MCILAFWTKRVFLIMIVRISFLKHHTDKFELVEERRACVVRRGDVFGFAVRYEDIYRVIKFFPLAECDMAGQGSFSFNSQFSPLPFIFHQF